MSGCELHTRNIMFYWEYPNAAVARATVEIVAVFHHKGYVSNILMELMNDLSGR